MKSTIIKENIPLAPYTIFKIGGPARFFAEVRNLEELKYAFCFSKENNLPFLILGEGSNVLISDAGFPGLTLRNRILGIESQEAEDFIKIKAGGGENWDKFVEFAVQKGGAGVECLSGIPGTVGAAPVQNIGAYGQSASDTIELVEAFDLETGEEKFFTKKECAFGYRTSRFKDNSTKYFITAVNFKLQKNRQPSLDYHDLKDYFRDNPHPTLSAVREAVLEIRFRKGMVVTGEELHTSVGSFFINPVISQEHLAELKFKVGQCRKFKDCCTDPWFWELPDGKVKISAACLIECAGFSRGLKIGRVGISPFHSLAITNFGGASAAEVLFLAERIRTEVKKKFGIDLEIEPRLVGFDK